MKKTQIIVQSFADKSASEMNKAIQYLTDMFEKGMLSKDQVKESIDYIGDRIGDQVTKSVDKLETLIGGR